mmetsp:Transcript_55311/g.59923  ORF Transcript_55311/g.59923 Transcript_55311/m.59923 type:complete len:90 (-) Transcript_55311:79-348(-)
MLSILALQLILVMMVVVVVVVVNEEVYVIETDGGSVDLLSLCGNSTMKVTVTVILVLFEMNCAFGVGTLLLISLWTMLRPQDTTVLLFV